MAIYHCDVKVISRSSGRLAIASAAYRSGERLFDEELGRMYDFTKKSGVILNEIMLCKNAPEKYKDRETLWNDVQRVELRPDAQLAREVEVALPTEMTREQQIECVRNYIKENFVSQGMIADWALHDKGTGNPHAHIMLTVRPFDFDGQWSRKQRSVYANRMTDEFQFIYDPRYPAYDPSEPMDASGHRPSEKYKIPKLNPDGTQKERVRPGKGAEKLWERVTIPEIDWNQRDRVEEWREAWANECNKYLDKEHQIDHRSYERQGLDILPTRHEGYSVRKLEQQGITSEIGDANREIRRANAEFQALKREVEDLEANMPEEMKMELELERVLDGSNYKGDIKSLLIDTEEDREFLDRVVSDDTFDRPVEEEPKKKRDDRRRPSHDLEDEMRDDHIYDIERDDELELDDEEPDMYDLVNKYDLDGVERDESIEPDLADDWER